MKQMRRTVLTLLVALMSLASAVAQTLRVPTIIGDNMVLQRNTTAHLWGWANAGEEVTIKASWLKEPVKVATNDIGEWIADVPTGEAATKQKVKIYTESEELSFGNIMIGEVWVCSGQSNMQFQVGKTIDLLDALKSPNPNIRLYNSGRISSRFPMTDIPEAEWTTTAKRDLTRFSAVGYAFGDKLQRELGVPVGLICVAYGGTSIESWMPEESVVENLLFVSGLKKSLVDNQAKWKGADRYYAAAQYNANINPIINTTVAGVIWYQGCHNVSYAATYYDKLQEKMIESWREKFNNPTMPFYLVQLVPHIYEDIKGAQLRESQAEAANRVEGADYVPTMDCLDVYGDIHPRNKKVVGERLAAKALGHHYGRTDVEYLQPEYERMQVEEEKIRLYFRNADKGLTSSDGNELRGFQIGDERGFVHASAKVENGNEVVVWADGILNPTAVRYCFNEGIGNLVGGNSWPVGPFRTDRDNNQIGLLPNMYDVCEMEVSVRGGNFTLGRLEPNAPIWSNRPKYHFRSVIESIEGFQMLLPEWKNAKEMTPYEVTFTAKKSGRIYVLVRNYKYLTDQGWSVVPASVMNVYDPKKGFRTRLMVGYHDIEAGESVTFEVGTNNPSGIIPIAKKFKYKK